MKRSLLIIALLINSVYAYSQDNIETYQEVMENIMTYFNDDNYQGIFDLCDENMQVAVPLENFTQQLKGLKSQIGRITQVSFIENSDLGYVFKVDHEVAPLEYVISLNDSNKIIGLRPRPFTARNIDIIERNTTKMNLPFNEEWFVLWGGTEVAKNYHVAYENQKYAYDIVMLQNGKSYKGDSKTNDNYFVFGKDIIAPCDAKVVQVITGVHDNIPGEMNPKQVTGNTVVIETEAKEYILFAHLKQGSVVVKEGQMLKQGDLIGHCGNSGNSSEPHLHLSLQNTISMFGATGGKLFFDKISVNGEVKEDYLPEKNDKIQNIKL